MKTTIKIEMNGKSLPAEVEFHYSEMDGCITDVTAIKIKYEGGICNLLPIYGAICESILEDLQDKYVLDEYEH